MSGKRPDPLGLAAAEYARLGFAVFPVRPRGKKPLTPHGHLDATTDLEIVRHWWGVHPAANIGLPIPPWLVVVDLDGPEAPLQLKAEDRELPTTARSTTGRGVHLYYRTQAEIRNAVGLFPGVDLRGVGGYTVVPPSIHSTGARYRWEVPLVPGNITDAPGWLLEAARKRGSRRVRAPEEWRQIGAEGASKGERNSIVASLAGHLLRRHVDPFVVLELLLSWNATRCRPPLSKREVERTVDSIAGRELRRRCGCA